MVSLFNVHLPLLIIRSCQLYHRAKLKDESIDTSQQRQTRQTKARVLVTLIVDLNFIHLIQPSFLTHHNLPVKLQIKSFIQLIFNFNPE